MGLHGVRYTPGESNSRSTRQVVVVVDGHPIFEEDVPNNCEIPATDVLDVHSNDSCDAHRGVGRTRAEVEVLSADKELSSRVGERESDRRPGRTGILVEVGVGG